MPKSGRIYSVKSTYLLIDFIYNSQFSNCRELKRSKFHSKCPTVVRAKTQIF